MVKRMKPSPADRIREEGFSPFFYVSSRREKSGEGLFMVGLFYGEWKDCGGEGLEIERGEIKRDCRGERLEGKTGSD